MLWLFGNSAKMDLTMTWNRSWDARQHKMSCLCGRSKTLQCTCARNVPNPTVAVVWIVRRSKKWSKKIFAALLVHGLKKRRLMTTVACFMAMLVQSTSATLAAQWPHGTAHNIITVNAATTSLGQQSTTLAQVAGRGLCPLGVPHPPNVAADLTAARETNTTHKSFVIGCLACLGFQDEGSRPVENDINHFGFPARDWSAFTSGAEFLATAGSNEVRERLRLQWSALPQTGSILECAERVLLSELKLPTPAASVNAAAVLKPAKLLSSRLQAVGLPSGGSPLEKSTRLLLIRTICVEDMLRAAAIGYPAALASVMHGLPDGQANHKEPEVAVLVLGKEQEHALEHMNDAWQCANQTVVVKPPSSNIPLDMLLSKGQFRAGSLKNRSLNDWSMNLRRRKRRYRASCMCRLRARDDKYQCGSML